MKFYLKPCGTFDCKNDSKPIPFIDLKTQFHALEKRGSYYSYGDTRLGQGRESAKDFLRANPEIADAHNMALIFPKNINELTTISPAFILIEAGDIDSAQLSTPNTLNTTPITSIVHQTV